METLKDTQYNLTEETRREDILIWREVYSLHIVNKSGKKEAIIADHSDYSKIHAIMSLDFFNYLMDGGNTT